jgi:gluconolactonase
LLVDRELGLIACQPGSRSVVRLDADGKLTLLAERYQGGRFNSPNDLTVDAKGRIYFSDPRYGSREGMEILDDGGRTVEGVYRIDGPGRVVRILTHEVDRPNGLLVSPDDRYLYVADNNNNTPGAARQLVRFDLRLDGSLDPASKKILFDWGNGRGADGFEMDSVGRLWVAAGRNVPNPPNETIDFPGGVYVLSPEGELLGLLPIAGDEVTNVAFAGPRLKTLFVTAGGTLWSMETAVPGLSVLSRP